MAALRFGHMSGRGGDPGGHIGWNWVIYTEASVEQTKTNLCRNHWKFFQLMDNEDHETEDQDGWFGEPLN